MYAMCIYVYVDLCSDFLKHTKAYLHHLVISYINGIYAEYRYIYLEFGKQVATKKVKRAYTI